MKVTFKKESITAIDKCGMKSVETNEKPEEEWKMSEETLYETARPLVTFITLYGVNWRSEQRTGWKILKLSQLFTFLIIVSFVIYDTVTTKIEDKKDRTRRNMLMLVNSSCFLYCSFRWRPLTSLLDLLKTCEMPKRNSQAFRKIRKFLWLLYCVPTIMFGTVLFYGGLDTVRSYPEKTANPEGVPAIIYGFVIIVSLTPLCILLRLLLALPAVCALIFLATYYTDITVKRSIEELNRCKSPIRRAKMITKLIQRCDHLFRLTTAANAIGANLIFTLKISASYIFFVEYYALVAELDIDEQQNDAIVNYLLNMIGVAYVVIMLVYLKVAPSANEMSSAMSSSLIKSMVEGDGWLSRDPISRPFLLRTRVDHLAHLNHLALQQPPLTILDEPIEGDGIFKFLVDMIDTFNLISSAK